MADFHNRSEKLEETSTPNRTNVESFGQADQIDPKFEERDELGRRKYDENGEKIHWATKSQRITAWVLAIIVILITLSYAYSIYTGDLFFR